MYLTVCVRHFEKKWIGCPRIPQDFQFEWMQKFFIIIVNFEVQMLNIKIVFKCLCDMIFF